MAGKIRFPGSRATVGIAEKVRSAKVLRTTQYGKLAQKMDIEGGVWRSEALGGDVRSGLLPPLPEQERELLLIKYRYSVFATGAHNRSR